ncbi:S8 family serine peptidase [Pontibacter oryzae]|uniref:T9SS C-terminal target domain-containing protein n=1 Tax=Pontibacter oryzae TaxID=2304593 RepID=A0A399SIX4_9BACT|nr:S8 family serine peptidase [Pontibacter oryzae]RIJ43148.1 T9SS C-terminal target domain-containing protein [Pontibacter oryzae]
MWRNWHFSSAKSSLIFGLFILCLAGPIVAQQKPAEQLKVAAPLLKSMKAASIFEVRVLSSDQAQLSKWVKEYLPHLTLKQTQKQRLTLGNLQPQDLAILQTCPWITYIDRGNRQAQEELELKDSDLAANNIPAVHGLYPALIGSGLTVSVKENPFDTTDIDFKGRVLPSAAFKEPHALHATTMATVIAGAGNSSPEATGVARGAMLSSSSFANLMPDDLATLNGQGVSVQNHSYGVGLENYYGLESMAYDEQAIANPKLLHVFSSGNSGSQTPTSGTYAGIKNAANLTGQFKTSKNTLSVGALTTDRTVGALSSTGPTYDGRVKPELVAHGVGGTSEAAAVVSGVALLVQQAYANLQNGQLPDAALVKAILINSADDVEQLWVDFKSGFGNVDALGAVQAVQDQRYFTGSSTQGETDKFILQVPEGIDQLKVTLVWHDAPAQPDAPVALVNDLDLRLQHTASGSSWLPWVLSSYPHPDSLVLPAKRRPDHLNNIEQISLLQPTPGTYEIQINGYAIGQAPQPYSIAYEYTSGLGWTYPANGSTLKASTTNRLRWSGPAHGKARLEYKISNSSTWTLVTEEIDLSQPYYDWTTPTIFAKAQLRLITENQTIVSEEFILGPVTQAALTLNCNNELLLQWPQVPGATAYQLYSLTGNYLEPLLITTDTVATLAGTDQIAAYFSVAPVLENNSGLKSNTIAINPDEQLCYIYSFLPKQLVQDSVLLDLQLSTSYQIQEVALERWEQGAFRTIQSLPTSQKTAFVFYDANPEKGLNRYRARVTAQGRPFYSQPEEVFFTKKGFMQLAPNPVVAGEEIQIIAHGEGMAQLALYSITGQLIRTFSDAGVIKQMSTAGLPAGVYILKVVTEQGEKLSSRLLVL